MVRRRKLIKKHNLNIYSPIPPNSTGGPAKISSFIANIWTQKDLGRVIIIAEAFDQLTPFKYISISANYKLITIGGEHSFLRKFYLIITLRHFCKKNPSLFLGQFFVVFFSIFLNKRSNKIKKYFRYNGEPIYERISNIFPYFPIESYYSVIKYLIIPRLLIIFILKHFDHIIVSSNTSKWYIDKYISSSLNIKVIQNPVPEVQVNIKNEKRSIDFLIVGRIIKLKRIDLAINMVPEGSIIHVVGEGPELNYLKNKNPGVIFHGFLESNELNKLYLNSKYIVSMSVSEQSPNVIIEAKTFGCVFIGSNIMAHKELANINDLIVDCNKYERSKEQINKFVKNYKNQAILLSTQKYNNNIKNSYTESLCS